MLVDPSFQYAPTDSWRVWGQASEAGSFSAPPHSSLLDSAGTLATTVADALTPSFLQRHDAQACPAGDVWSCNSASVGACIHMQLQLSGGRLSDAGWQILPNNRHISGICRQHHLADRACAQTQADSKIAGLASCCAEGSQD